MAWTSTKPNDDGFSSTIAPTTLICCPSTQVPALVHNGVTVCQSIAILEYLDEVFPETPLLPKKDAATRAAVCVSLHRAHACARAPTQHGRTASANQLTAPPLSSHAGQGNR